MRGTIEVTGASDAGPESTIPLYVTLDLDIDSPHTVSTVPPGLPSAVRGQNFIDELTVDLSTDYYRSHSPYQAFHDLANTSLMESERWDVVAYIWQSNTTREALENGQELYAQNCAACHGESAAGDGVFADDLKQAGESSTQFMTGAEDMVMQSPADFTDPRRMLGASPALLQGKILRGGMGTGMPMWGSIFTEQQIWDLTTYLYAFQFRYQGEIQ
jgi:mono/diheme cytochrome c family protein